MEMDPPKFVVMMDVVTLVEPAPQDKAAATVLVLVKQIVLEDNAVMMVVDMNHVVNVRPLKHAKMEFVLAMLKLSVLEEFVVTTELVDLAEPVQQDKDAEQDNVSAIMTVMKETVAMLLSQTDPILPLAHKDLVVHVLLDSHVNPMEDAQLRHLVTF